MAVHSRSQGHGAGYARKWDIPYAYNDLDALLSDNLIDAVYVSTTNERHHEATIAAASAGKHVLCEKPLALNLDDATSMVETCREAGVVLGTNHGRRNDASVRAAQELVRSGRLGTLLSARTSNCTELPERLRGWRLTDVSAGAGAVLDLAVHEADTLRFVLADEPGEVTAFTGSHGLSSAGVEDSVMGLLKMESGLLASFACSFATPCGEVGFELHGSKASLFARRRLGQDPIVWVRSPGDEEVIRAASAEPIGHATVRAFEAAVRGEGSPTASGEDGLRSLAVALGVAESAVSGRAVSLNPPEMSSCR